ncbi:MAG: mechanosensitive ion channel family protein [archaeon]
MFQQAVALEITGLNILKEIQSVQLADFLEYNIIIPLLIIVLTPLVAGIVDHAFFHLEKNSKKKLDITRQRVVRSLVKASIYIIGFVLLLYYIPPLRAIGVGIFASVGVLGIIVGLAAQDSLANLVAGLTIAMYQPFRLGDRLRIANEDGIVEDITLRHTVIKTWENKRIIIPNHIISKESIINYTITDPKILKFIDIGISYDSDIDLARKIMLEETRSHKDVILDIQKSKSLVNSPEIPVVRLRQYGDSSIMLRLLFWAPDEAVGIRIGYELLESIKKRFDKEGIEIPFPYRTIVYKKDLPKPKTLKNSKKAVSGTHNAANITTKLSSKRSG